MKQYPKYKNSKIDWIGEIPEEWKALPNRAIFQERIEREGEELELLAITIKNGVIKQCEYEQKKDTSSIDKSNYKIIYPDDLGYNKMRMWQGAIGYSQYKGIVSPAYIILNPKLNIVSKFYYYSYKSNRYISEFNKYSYGICDDMNSLRYEDFKTIYSVHPPIEEQKIITTYLDKKTQQIDTLIEKKQKQVELLKEYRIAIINQAVTKGLNPNVKMKDSGIEWLGQIPEHWEVKRLKRISKIKYGLGQPPTELEGGLPIIRATDIHAGKIFKDNLIYVDPDDIPYERDPILKENDIIVVRSGAYTGDSCIIPKEYDGAVTGYDMVIRVNVYNPKYVAYSLLSFAILNNQINLFRIRAAQPHLNVEELGSVFIFMPSIEEQEKIVNYLDDNILKTDSNIENDEKQIKQLQEYRITLISDAVTGKIDVRDEVN